MSQRLPSFPNLDFLKKQAKDVLRVSRYRGRLWRLADAQHALARGYGFSSWPRLKRHVESMRRRPGSAAASVPRKQGGKTAAGASALAAAAHSQPRCSSHPIVGTWVARPTTDINHDSRANNVVVEFELADDTIILTQIAGDPAGRDVAMKMAIQIDGLDHPIQFGNNLTLQAWWTNERTLETITKHGAQAVAKGTYEVAANGQSLVVSTPDHLVVFERCSPCCASRRLSVRCSTVSQDGVSSVEFESSRLRFCWGSRWVTPALSPQRLEALCPAIQAMKRIGARLKP